MRETSQVKNYVSETKKYLEGNITGRSSSFIHKDLLNWGSHQCPKTDLHTLLYTCTLYLDRNSQAYNFSQDITINCKPPIQLILTNAACEEGEGMADVNGDGEETQVIE